jgi:hypothetical protein
MNCRKVQSYLSAYSDSKLPSDRSKELEVHIRNCKRCEQEKLFFDQITATARALPAHKLPDDFNLKLMNRIYAEQYNPTESYLPTEAPTFFGTRLRWVSAVAAVCVCAVVAFFGLQQAPLPEQPQTTPMFTVTQPEPVTIMPAAAGRQPSIRMYDDIIGVSGPASNYRATNVGAIRTFHLADSQVESLFVDLQRRMGSSPSRGLRSDWRSTTVNSASSYSTGLRTPLQQAGSRQ